MSILSNHYPEVLEQMNEREEAEALAGAPESWSQPPTDEEVNAMGEAAGQLLCCDGSPILEVLPEDAPADRKVPSNVRRTRKPRVRPVRSVRLITPPLAGVPGIVAITVGKDLFTYWISPLASDFGRGFRLEKFGNGESYSVNLGGDGHHPSCECPGFEKWGCNQKDGHACKHLDACKALVNCGKL